uniref:AAA+ ATPase domain-containing protein n=1 Tax=Chromera velia CCMP2878 TaxID=1169474 RepID=A0A0G4I3J0_9ALVE|eukprot:Cvel_10640.t1-p1 / transcript=Cvel_10640.t1 / gene=Cvel_10640 / organism=Chromera_velia_CCMP2878 / gene_product=Protein white, putative / transcript_product=Protein white, putative / location=Cvel_scaffold646:39761-44475(-) / protein_length=727 / sequence_SO=supercontig / SO=protein_coding / is_pseudo=false
MREELLNPAEFDGVAFQHPGSGRQTPNDTSRAQSLPPHRKNNYNVRLPTDQSFEPVTLDFDNLEVEVTVQAQGKGMRIPCQRAQTEQKKILKGVTGSIPRGSVVAVLGASGAGKSTLLNCLSRRKIPTGGQVTWNGRPLDSEFVQKSAYVQQEDIFFGNLTVREHLWFAARLRLPPSIPLEEKSKLVDSLIERLGLSKCKDSVIGSIATGGSRGISGGERKRLSVATEILTNPSVLFCDEPTSGLDSFMAQSVVQLLQEIAASGRTVVATIHQPSSEIYAMFDKVMLLAEGRLVFFGDRDAALSHFQSQGLECPVYTNPADFYIRTLAVPFGDTEKAALVNRLADRWSSMSEADRQRLGEAQRERSPGTTGTGKDSEGEATPEAAMEEGRKNGGSAREVKVVHQSASQRSLSTQGGGGEGVVVTEGNSAAVVSAESAQAQQKGSSYWSQFSILLGRALLNVFRDPLLSKVRLMQTLLIGLIFGTIFFRIENNQRVAQNKSGAIFFLLINQSMTSVFGVLQTFPLEKPIALREYESGAYSILPYYAAKVFADFPLQLFFPSLFTLICYYMGGLNDDIWAFLWTLLTVLMVTNSAISIGYCISALSKNVGVALAVGPVAILPFMLFSGFFLNTDDIPSYWIWLEYLSFFKYGFSACLTAIFGFNYPEIDCPDPTGRQCAFKTGDDVLRFFSVKKENFATDLLALFAMIVGFRLLGALFMWLACRKKQNA